MINVVDRVPTKPNRVRITHEDGTSEYVTWERADEPTVAGTPINKALFESIRDDLPLTNNVTRFVSTSGSDSTGDGSQVAPYATIQKAIDSIPCNLGGYTATINIAPGTYPEYVQANNYHGGLLNIGTSTTTGVVINGFYAHNCSYVVLNVNTIEYSQAVTGVNPLFNVVRGSLVMIGVDLTINNDVSNTGQYSFYVTSGATVLSQAARVVVNNSPVHAVFCSFGSVYVPRFEGVNNKGHGIYCIAGGIVAFTGNGLEAVTRMATANGGRIYADAQTNIPQY